ncbi:MAG: YitT family protein [Candidatus Rhabdochlamydia sp.]
MTAAKKSLQQYIITYFWLMLGSFLAAFSIHVFLLPSSLIDGGTVGVALILSRLFGESYLSLFLIVLNLPFIYLAYKYIRKSFVITMGVALLFFALFLVLVSTFPSFEGDPIEVTIIGGAILGVGVGLIIRHGGCLDGTEILAILINRKQGFTVGQVVLFINFFIFTAYGWIFANWHHALQSLITYIVAFKMMDLVIMGIEELKSVMIISAKPQKMANVIMAELRLGLTIVHGKGGFTGDTREILYIIIERLDLAALKELVLREDPTAFMAIENLHEVVYGKHAHLPYKKKKRSFL